MTATIDDIPRFLRTHFRYLRRKYGPPKPKPLPSKRPGEKLALHRKGEITMRKAPWE